MTFQVVFGIQDLFDAARLGRQDLLEAIVDKGGKDVLMLMQEVFVRSHVHC